MAKILTLPTSALRARITLYIPLDVADGMGGHVRSWQAASTRWAHIIQSPSNAAQVRGVANARLRVVIRRANPPFELPLRLQWKGVVYRVVQLQDVFQQGVQQLICERLA